MHWIDLVVVGFYLAGTLYIGFRLTKRIESSQDYFLAGRKLPFWAIGMSLVVSDIGALEMIGGTAGAFRYGVAQANFEWIGCVPAMIVGALVFMPIYYRSGIYSVPEYLGRRYGPVVQGLQAALWTFFLAAALGVFFQASAKMFHSVFGWPEWLSVGLTAVIVTVYTVGGGLEAVVTTDVIQCVVLFIGGLTLAGIGLSKAGGISGLRASLDAMGPGTRDHLRLLMPVDKRDAKGKLTGYPWSGILLGLGVVLSPAYWLGNQAIVQRVLGAKDNWSTRASMVFGAGLKTVVPLAFVLPGLLGLVLFAKSGISVTANEVYPEMIKRYLPVGLRGLLYAAFLAALMSSVDSYTNSAATIFARDIYRRFLKPDQPDGHYLKVGRIAAFAIIALGVAMVPVVAAYKTVYDAFQSFLSYFQGPTLALIVFGLLSRRPTPAGGVTALVGGVAAAYGFGKGFDLHYLHTAWWSFATAAALLVVVSALSKPLPDDELDALVYRSRSEP